MKGLAWILSMLTLVSGCGLKASEVKLKQLIKNEAQSGNNECVPKGAHGRLDDR